MKNNPLIYVDPNWENYQVIDINVLSVSNSILLFELWAMKFAETISTISKDIVIESAMFFAGQEAWTAKAFSMIGKVKHFNKVDYSNLSSVYKQWEKKWNYYYVQTNWWYNQAYKDFKKIAWDNKITEFDVKWGWKWYKFQNNEWLSVTLRDSKETKWWTPTIQITDRSKSTPNTKVKYND